jgi:hypothetical protein
MILNKIYLRWLYDELKLGDIKDVEGKSVIDAAVYKDGLFRIIHSTKCNEHRPFIHDLRSDVYHELETFIGYCPLAAHEIYGEIVEAQL